MNKKIDFFYWDFFTLDTGVFVIFRSGLLTKCDQTLWMNFEIVDLFVFSWNAAGLKTGEATSYSPCPLPELSRSYFCLWFRGLVPH